AQLLHRAVGAGGDGPQRHRLRRRLRRGGAARAASAKGRGGAGMIPTLQVLFDAVAGGAVEEYGGNPRWTGVAANFVESLDGVVALPEARGESGGVVSGGSEADRFIMGLLRACADAVLIGAGTL